MSLSERLKRYTHRFWQERRAFVGEKADGVLASCLPEEREYLEFVLATLPLSDLGDYEPELFLSFVRSAMRAREEFPWCAALSEELFLLGVLYPRTNTEELAACRDLFHDALIDRVKGLSLKEAILEVNRWCAEEVTYRSTDDRTASPLAVYRCGYGRCGEESTFSVNAFRSVGICARQVYAPFWSHCDDNHAWVEVFDGKAWRYLGACEPEPELDRGWFTSAASRAMLIHARAFLPGEPADFSFLFPETDPADLWAEHGVVYEAVTARYGETRPFTVFLKDDRGTPLSEGVVTFSILNMARFFPIARKQAGENGAAQLPLGLGSIAVSAVWGELSAEALVDTSETEAVDLVLQRRVVSGGEAVLQEASFLAPAGAQGYPAPLTEDGRKKRREWLDSAALLREKKQLRLSQRPVESRTQEEQRILSLLTEKDRAGGIRREILQDSFSALSWEASYPREVFEQGLLSLRIGLEPLRPWREKLAAAFSPEEQGEFRKFPEKVWEWIGRQIREAICYPALPATPWGTFQLRAANPTGRAVLFCALCRSLGIPARLSPVDGTPEYYREGWRKVSGEELCGTLSLTAPEEQEALCGQNYSLSRLERGGEVFLTTADLSPKESAEISLRPGSYRLLTVSRMPNGNQLSRQLMFSLAAGEARRFSLSFREGQISDMLESQGLPPFSLKSGEGQTVNSGELLQESPASIFFWLEAGREPTEHILNELRESAQVFEAADCALHFLLESPEQEGDPTLQKTLPLLPKARLWQGDFQDTVSLLARQMFVDPEKLPLVILADRKGNGLYACSGYNVGTGKLLLRLLAELDK